MAVFWEMCIVRMALNWVLYREGDIDELVVRGV